MVGSEGDVDGGGQPRGQQEVGAAPDTGPGARHVVTSSRLMSPRARVLAGCVLVLVASVMLVHEAVSGVKSIANQQTASVVSRWAKFDAQQQCLRDAITRGVPRGSHFYISQGQQSFIAGQLAELSIPWATPVASRAQASYTLAIVPGSQCEGMSLTVQAIR